MKKILLIGKAGQLGTEIREKIEKIIELPSG